MKNAILKAIEGGMSRTIYFRHGEYIEELALLHPIFWQSLGKQQGWVDRTWNTRWHQFIDHIAEGGTADGFFAALIK